MEHESLKLTKREVVLLIVGFVVSTTLFGIVGRYDYENELLIKEVETKKEELRQRADEHNSVIKLLVEKQKELDKQGWGIGSWYDYRLEGENGVPCFRALESCYTQNKLFAASRDFARGSRLKVINLVNKKWVEVLVVDYIDHPKGIIDLTSFAFSQIADLGLGLIDVKVEYLGIDKNYASN